VSFFYYVFYLFTLMKIIVYRHHQPSLLSSRFARLDATSSCRLVIPSSSTAVLGPETNGNVQCLPNIVLPEVRIAVERLHRSDIGAGASAIVTATCGGHNRQTRPDPLPYPIGIRNQQALEEYIFRINRLAVEAACNARRDISRFDIPVFGSVLTSGDCYDGSRQLSGISEGNLKKLYYQDHESQIRAFASGSDRVDAILVEAGGVSVPELLAIVELARDVRLPIIVSLVVGDNGRILDTNSTDEFSDLTRAFSNIANDLFLGLSLNCNSRRQTQAGLKRDEGHDVLLAYTNSSEISALQRAVGNWDSGDPVTVEQELVAFRWFIEDFPYLRGGGSCCREERSEDLLQGCRTLFEL
jgi:S-methylmethionine-dependent homocysteine/selenocysteine methylase